ARRRGPRGPGRGSVSRYTMTVSGSSPETPVKIAMRGVSKAFGDGGNSVAALANLDLSVPEGAFVSVVGPSGCGKTTILRLVDGLVGADAGAVLVSGQPPSPGPKIGFVFQAFRLIPWATVEANVEFALTSLGLDRNERAE